ncbi:MAG: DUF1080 domain-containing protein, partial [Saprospiraceae bacterium]|nr:DUF1080 domain-containing protein [Saprospiraceae bacterium]
KTGSGYGMYTTTSGAYKARWRVQHHKIIVNEFAHREHWLNGVKVLEFKAWTPDWEKERPKASEKNIPIRLQ